MAASIRIVCPGDSPVKIMKWKVKKDSMVMKGSVLALYESSGSKFLLKLKSTDTGIIDEIFVEAGSEAKAGEVLVTLRQQTLGGCSHPTVMKDMCADCGADLRREAGMISDRKKVMSASVAMVHNIPELIVSQEQALEIGREDEQRLLKTRKLVLLVDLDQTLIHTTNDNIPPNLKDVYHFQMWQGHHATWYHTRLRPHTLRFLENVSKMFELHICTFGVRLYAHTVARLIDPDEKFFSHRILSRDECFDPLSKTANLKALFPCGDAMVCIIDDREDVWNRAPNLVHVKPYRFFQGTADINAPPGLGKSENDIVPIVHKVIDRCASNSSTSEEGKTVADGKKDDSELTSSGNVDEAGSLENTDCQHTQRVAAEEMDNDDTHVQTVTSVSRSETDGACQQDVAETVGSSDTEGKIVSGQVLVRETAAETQILSSSLSDVDEGVGMTTQEGDGSTTDPDVQKPEPGTEDQLAQDLCVSSDSDSVSGDLSDSGSTKEEEDSLSVNTHSQKLPYGDFSVIEPQLMDTYEVLAARNSESTPLKPDVEESSNVDISITESTNVNIKLKENSVKDTSGKDVLDVACNDGGGSSVTKSKLSMKQAAAENKVLVCEADSELGETTDGTPEAEEETKSILSIENDTKQSSDANALTTEKDKDDTVNISEEVEWDDEDDYLLHLEEILTRIHQAFYSMVDERCHNSPKQPESKSSGKDGLPDLKSLIPYVKRKTLIGCNIVFSGLVPLNTTQEKSHAYMVAKALGATVQTEIVGPKEVGKKRQVTTHLVASKPGTSKHKTAMRTHGVHIVSGAWLWACNERWEHCDERIFPLGSGPNLSSSDPEKHSKKKMKKHRKHKLDESGDNDTGHESGDRKRQKTTKEEGGASRDTVDLQSEETSDSSERSGGRFADTVAPLLAFSDEDLECMDKEVDELMAEEPTGSEDETDDERDKRYRDSVLGSANDSGSSSDSLSGEFPRGWHLRRKSKASPRASEDDLEKQQQKEVEVETEDTENELVRFQKTVETFSPDSESNSNSFADSIGSVDDEIAEAVEKEFLGSL